MIPCICARGTTFGLRTESKLSSQVQHGQAAGLRGAVKLTVKQLSGPTFALESKGASEVTLSGNIDRLLVDMTGASQLAAAGLQTKTAEISTTGAGDSEVAVSDTLNVAITGAGKVTYSGNPATIKKQITGAGSIRHKD